MTSEEFLEKARMHADAFAECMFQRIEEEGAAVKPAMEVLARNGLKLENGWVKGGTLRFSLRQLSSTFVHNADPETETELEVVVGVKSYWLESANQDELAEALIQLQASL